MRRPHRWTALRAAIAGLAAVLVCAAPAAAFTPPELFVRFTNAYSSDHTPQSDWIPLAGAPDLNWLGGYEIGYRYQDAPGEHSTQRAALQITGVPDGQPTQPQSEPYCGGLPAEAGQIVPVGSALQYEGNGTYAVRVWVGPPSGDHDDCMSSPSTASSDATFSVSVGVAPTVAGTPLIFRAKPLAGNPFLGVIAAEPPGGSANVRCALDATVQPDGSLTGALVAPEEARRRTVIEDEFPRPGKWTCVARGFVEGVDDNLHNFDFFTPWSAPLALDVRTDFRRAKGQISKPSSKRPTMRFTAEFAQASRGGTATLKLKRFVRCKGRRAVLKSAGGAKGKLDSKGRTTMKIRRPSTGYYLGSMSFSGTEFVTRSVDPNPLRLEVTDRGRLEYVSAQAFPGC